MKSILCLLLFAVAASQVSAKKLNVTVFYMSLCRDSFPLYRNQIWPAYQDKTIQENVYFELVPFGRANYTENPWSITCQNGPRECMGNALDACFIAKNPDNYKQVALISCSMSDPDPPTAGEKCAKKLGYSYEGVKECSTNKEGIALQIKNGRRTLDFRPKLTWIPTIVFDNVFNASDHWEAQVNMKGIILRKLKEKGVSINEE